MPASYFISFGGILFIVLVGVAVALWLERDDAKSSRTSKHK
jgi:hypothetical protein